MGAQRAHSQVDPARLRALDLRVDEAKAVLDANWTGRATIPAPGLYPHQWNWDTGFIAIGRSRYAEVRAQTEMLSLFDAQWRNGKLPSIAFSPEVASDAYFPGPDFWRSRESPDAPRAVATTGITQPPVHAIAALEMHRHADDADRSEAFLRLLFPGLVALHRYLRDHRSTDRGLAWFLHPWESGLDNSPAWDEAFARVDVPSGAVSPYRRRDLRDCDARDRPTDEDYDRYVHLAMLYRDTGYDDARIVETTPFLVEDPMFNSIWAWSADALGEIAEIIGEDRLEFAEDAAHIVDGIEAGLWSSHHRWAFPNDLRSGSRMSHRSVVSVMPMIAPGIDAAIVDRIVEVIHAVRRKEGGHRFVIPTEGPRSQSFSPRRYWRGPVWANTNWLLQRGARAAGEFDLSDDLRDSTLDMVIEHGFREYFDPTGSAAYGARNFSWTAALFLDLVLGT